MCNYVKIETGQNFPPILIIVTRTAQAALNVNVAMRACDQSSILVLAGNFTLTMASIGVTCSYSSRPFLCALGCSLSVLTTNIYHGQAIRVILVNTCYFLNSFNVL